MGVDSDVKICNIALGFLGAERINSLTSDNDRARICNEFYLPTLETILTDAIWTFAQKRAVLATLDADPVWTDDNMTIVYQKPTDCLKVNFVNINGAVVKLEQDKILSDTAGLKIKYTFLQTNTQLFFSQFIFAFGTLLAGNIAFALTASRSLAADLVTVYNERRLPEAMANDSQQGTPLEPIQDQWLLSRIQGGSGTLVGRTGASTWFPACC